MRDDKRPRRARHAGFLSRVEIICNACVNCTRFYQHYYRLVTEAFSHGAKELLQRV